ncbi:type II secretion system GspH family protein [Patescibacteria group bacterium]|nr:type II secretion system GspH family protein [Patescibacteria group bacterium]
MKLLRKETNLSGFTMVEMIITMTILAIVIGAAITMINPVGQFEKARDSTRQRELQDYRVAIEAFATINGGSYYGDPAESTEEEIHANEDLCDSIPLFLSSCPADPINEAPSFYYYFVNSNRTGAALYAPLERSPNTLWVSCTNGIIGERLCAGYDLASTRITCIKTFCGY